MSDPGQILGADGASYIVLSQLGDVIYDAGEDLLRLAAIFLGFRTVRLGFDALVQGLQGKFDFGAKLNWPTVSAAEIADQARPPMEFKLVSASPGLFFVLLGTLLMAWAVIHRPHIVFPGQKIEARETAASGGPGGSAASFPYVEPPASEQTQ